jgi:hypothetical protein
MGKQMKKSAGMGFIPKLGLVVFVLFGIAVVKVIIYPPSPPSDKFVPTVMQGPAPRAEVASVPPPAQPDTASEVPLTEDQRLKIANFKAIVAALIAQHLVTDVDYDRGTMRLNVVQWDNYSKGDKEGVLQGLYVASFGNQRYKMARVFNDSKYEEFGKYVGVDGPTIER